MFRSIRVRLLAWYAIVLVAVIGGFAGTLYYQLRNDRLRQIDARLEAATRYLEVTLRAMPPGEGLGPPPPNSNAADDDGGQPLEFPTRGDRRPDGPPGRRPPGRGEGPGRPNFPDRPDRTDRPDRPRGPRRPFEGRPREGLAAALELPGSLLDHGDEEPQDWPYFAIWRGNRSLLTASIDGPEPPVPEIFARASSSTPTFLWRDPNHREALLNGPGGTLILVGKPMRRELAEQRTFAWQIVATGATVLAAGLAGGWILSRSITRPIEAIAQTASAISASNLAQRIDTPLIDEELVGLATILNQMFARLEGAFVRQSQFTADASHELRTPLAILRSHVELALSRPRSTEEYRETLAACLRASGRMAALVDGLLVLARADAGRIEPQFREVDLERVVAEAIEQFRPQADAQQVTLSASLAAHVTVHGDAAFLARIPANLLSNAIRHTPAGGSVKVSLSTTPNAVRLAIEDTGAGIESEDQHQIFQRFFRADKARSRHSGGNGLGLAICKTLVEAHGGQISFTSTVGQGTRFEVLLPMARGLPALN